MPSCLKSKNIPRGLQSTCFSFTLKSSKDYWMKLSDAKEKYERITTGFLEELIFFPCQTRRCMSVNKLVDPDGAAVTDTIILISFCHSEVLLCISVTFPLFLFFPVVCVLFPHPYFNNTLRVSKFQSLTAQQRKTGLTLVSTHNHIVRGKKKKKTQPKTRSSVIHKQEKKMHV